MTRVSKGERMKLVIDSEISEQTASDFALAVSGLEKDEPIEIEITSEGGSVTAGNIIVSKIRELSKSGHRTIAHVVSLAASMASVIACACDELVMDSNALMMIHTVWSCVQGNADQLRKEAETLDLFTRSLISVYRSKFDRTDEEIMDMLRAETWILGEQAELYGLKCKVNDVGSEIRIAARIDLTKFNNVPKGIEIMEPEEKKPEEDIETVETVEETETVEEEKKEEQAERVEDTEERPTYEELEKKLEENEKLIEDAKARIAELESQLEKIETETDDEERKTVTEEECSKRVSGMQAKMQNQINDFRNELKLKDKELTEANTKITSLVSELETTKGELSRQTSALEEKTNALAMLNANVNRPADNNYDPNGWRNLKGQAFWDFLAKHPEVKNQK